MKRCSYCGNQYPEGTIICSIDHTSLDNPPPSLSFVFPWTVVGLIIGFSANYVVVSSSLQFYSSFPFYSRIDAYGVNDDWIPLVYLTAFYSFLFGFPCGLIGIVKKRRWIGWLALLLVLAPGPLGWIILKISIHNGLIIES